MENNIERKVLVQMVYDYDQARQMQKLLQEYIDDSWLIEHTDHTSKALAIFLYREVNDER